MYDVLYRAYTPVLEIRLDDMTVFANSQQEETTLEWYEKLAEGAAEE